MNTMQHEQSIGVDLDPARRPGVPRFRKPEPWPNSKWPLARQPGVPATLKHGRKDKTMPPVFSTAIPLHGASGAVRKLAYRLPDHKPSHWFLLLAGDRVEWWGHRLRQVAMIALPAAVGFAGVRKLGSMSRAKALAGRSPAEKLREAVSFRERQPAG